MCVCVCGQDCWSALISAAKEGHVDVVKELLENSAYIEHRDMVGELSLMGNVVERAISP